MQTLQPPAPTTRRRSRRTWIFLGVAVVLVVALAGTLTYVLTRSRTPTPRETSLLAGRVGFGAGTTGGELGDLRTVTSSADSGPGSLREAVAGNGRKWVVFAKPMTITLHKAIDVGSNTTIDGRGTRVELTGHGVQGLDVIGHSNVIIESLTLHDFGDVTKTSKNDPDDAIHLERASKVWVDHDDLSMAGDKLIAVSGSTDVRVSWTHFHDQEQVFQIGNQATAKASAAQTVTIDHNFFDHTGYRNPVVSYGKAHVFNNYYLDWQLYAVRSQRAAQVLLQNNVFQAGQSTRGTSVTPSGDGCNDKKTRCDDRPGDLRAVGNVTLGGTQLLQSNPDAVFRPSYRYHAQPAGPALASEIQAHAGPLG